MGGDGDYYRHILEIFETTGRFLIVFVRLILGKVRVDWFTGPGRESNIRYACDLKIVLKDLGWK